MATGLLFLAREAAADREYRDELAIVDVGFGAMFATGALLLRDGEDLGTARGRTGQAFLTTGLLGALFAPALIHASHGHDDRMGWSLLLRAGVPGAVLLTHAVVSVADGTSCREDDSCDDRISPWLTGGVAFGLGVALEYLLVARPRDDAPSLFRVGGSF